MDLKFNEDKEKDKNNTSTITVRSLRQNYKCSLALLRNKELKMLEDKNKQFNSKECFRCLLAEYGWNCISKSIVRTCTLTIPHGVTTLCESIKSTVNNTDILIEDYIKIFGMSVALGMDESTMPIEIKKPPGEMIKSRKLKQLHELEKFDGRKHVCNNIQLKYHNGSLEIKHFNKSEKKWMTINKAIYKKQLSIQFNIDMKYDCDAKHVVFYAPSRSGKTVFQTKLSHNGIIIVDTDDIPFMSKSRLNFMLNWTSVLTNRLDLLDEHMPLVAFIPKNPTIILERIGEPFGLCHDDAKYVNQEHNFEYFDRVLIIKYEHSYLSNWFEETEQLYTNCEIKISQDDTDFLNNLLSVISKDVVEANHL